MIISITCLKFNFSLWCWKTNRIFTSVALYGHWFENLQVCFKLKSEIKCGLLWESHRLTHKMLLCQKWVSYISYIYLLNTGSFCDICTAFQTKIPNLLTSNGYGPYITWMCTYAYEQLYNPVTDTWYLKATCENNPDIHKRLWKISSKQF